MYQEEWFHLTSPDGIEIPAIFAEDDSSLVQSAMVLLHGISTHKNEYLDFFRTLARRLASRGVSSLRIDFRGHGDSALGPEEFTIASQLLDVTQAVEWLIESRGFSKVDLLGASFGAPPCIYTSVLFPNKINNVFLIAPVLDYFKTFVEPITEWGRELFGDLVKRTLINGEVVHITDDFFVHPRLVSEMCIIRNVESAINQTDKSLNVMHGNRDGMVDFGISRDIADRSPNLLLFPFDNMEHGFTDYGDEEGTAEATERNIDRMITIMTGGV